MQNKQIILKSRPHGMPDASNFELRVSEIPKGDVVVKASFLSVDPYMRGRMSDRPSYIPPFELGKPITGDVVGKVVDSKSPDFKVGDIVVGGMDWAEYSAAKPSDLQKLDPKIFSPPSLALGILGMPGMTAYFGLLDIGKPQPGETIVISGGAGAVGTVVGQIGKIKGCRVVGIVGSDEKANYLTKELHFDAAVNYKSPKFAEELKAACPKGVDVYFDNVGGDVTDQVMLLINLHARIPVCGQISMYNLGKPDIGPRHFRILITKSALARGFLVRLDYKDRYPEGQKQIKTWLDQGKIKFAETIANGLEQAPEAFMGLFKGDNLGKQIVRL